MKVQLSTVLKREFKSRDESANSIARACKIPISVLHGWINGVLPSAKNLHHVHTLSEYLSVPVSTLLFNVRDETNETSILFSSEFADGDMKYRLLVEKIKK